MDCGYQVKLVADACATMDLVLNGETIPAEMVQKAFIAALDGVFAKPYLDRPAGIAEGL